ncbi:helix-turn-helix domain-containing protein [Pseudochrobactrum sp. Wa41.01b-1]|uniref:helix-turn-helix transcriptional regulator n=1 Tax=Pseudochrobactrum sp. Wa41.01b-1 TaxID=2864102 RepID=UPI001C68D335|nr:helix-turn-helix domain-containing protein [Pseudochrobactrum sp. Wa41.01b-1]QYM73901.1 helix-turn-helix domain-containing protein [Pseudochrobactrum sp. Wa41.01b-1]
MKNIAPHLFTAAERILGSEWHPFAKEDDFVCAVAIAYEAVGFGSSNAEILKRAEAVFAKMQANAVPSAEPEPLLTPQQAASVARISERTLWRWVRERDISIKVGGRLWVNKRRLFGQ